MWVGTVSPPPPHKPPPATQLPLVVFLLFEVTLGLQQPTVAGNEHLRSKLPGQEWAAEGARWGMERDARVTEVGWTPARGRLWGCPALPLQAQVEAVCVVATRVDVEFRPSGQYGGPVWMRKPRPQITRGESGWRWAGIQVPPFRAPQ